MRKSFILAGLALASIAGGTEFVPMADGKSLPLVTQEATGAVPLAAMIPAKGPVIIIDGDTIRIDGVTIRLTEIDTPELRGSRCEAEYTAALAAKERLRALLNGGSVAYTVGGRYNPSGFDRYGRTVATVYAAGVDVGAALVREGYALAWEPGAEAKAARLAHWCGAA